MPRPTSPPPPEPLTGSLVSHKEGGGGAFWSPIHSLVLCPPLPSLLTVSSSHPLPELDRPDPLGGRLDPQVGCPDPPSACCCWLVPAKAKLRFSAVAVVVAASGRRPASGSWCCGSAPSRPQHHEQWRHHALRGCPLIGAHLPAGDVEPRYADLGSAQLRLSWLGGGDTPVRLPILLNDVVPPWSLRAHGTMVALRCLGAILSMLSLVGNVCSRFGMVLRVKARASTLAGVDGGGALER